jgi:hypothetical protein
MAKPKKAAPKRKPGRPATGRDPVTALRLPPVLLEQIDSWASERDISRSDAMRQLIEAGLKRRLKP